jgi:hypothetical protein
MPWKRGKMPPSWHDEKKNNKITKKGGKRERISTFVSVEMGNGTTLKKI